MSGATVCAVFIYCAALCSVWQDCDDRRQKEWKINRQPLPHEVRLPIFGFHKNFFFRCNVILFGYQILIGEQSLIWYCWFRECWSASSRFWQKEWNFPLAATEAGYGQARWFKQPEAPFYTFYSQFSSLNWSRASKCFDSPVPHLLKAMDTAKKKTATEYRKKL